MKKEKITVDELDELRKSLTILGMDSSEVEDIIEKAKKETEEVDDDEGGEEKEEGRNPGKKGEKPVEEKGEGTVEEQTEQKTGGDIEKSITNLIETRDNINKALSILRPDAVTINVDGDSIEKSFDSKFAEIELKLDSIEKALGGLDSLDEMSEKINSISELSMGIKSLRTGEPRYFSKSIDTDSDVIEKSFSKNKDEIIKGIEDMIENETNSDKRQILEDGIMELAVNPRPGVAGRNALKLYAKQNNISLVG